MHLLYSSPTITSKWKVKCPNAGNHDLHNPKCIWFAGMAANIPNIIDEVEGCPGQSALKNIFFVENKFLAKKLQNKDSELNATSGHLQNRQHMTHQAQSTSWIKNNKTVLWNQHYNLHKCVYVCKFYCIYMYLKPWKTHPISSLNGISPLTSS